MLCNQKKKEKRQNRFSGTCSMEMFCLTLDVFFGMLGLVIDDQVFGLEN